MRELKAILDLLGIQYNVTKTKFIGERIDGNGWDVIVWCDFDGDTLEFMNHETEETVQGLKNVVKAILEM